LSCSRLNMLPHRADLAYPSYAFYDNNHAVIRSVPLRAGEQAWSDDDSNCLARSVMDKVLTRTDGLQTVGYGNHDAQHNMANMQCNEITILHFPIRTYKQFERKVVNYGESLARNTRFSQGSSLHLRHWYKRYQEGALEHDYHQMTFDENRMAELRTQGFVVADNRVADFFNTKALGLYEVGRKIAA